MNVTIQSDPAGLLREAISITGNMLEAASHGDWETVIELEQDRTPLIAQNTLINAEMGALLQELQFLNIELEQLTSEARLAVAMSASTARQCRVAIETYGKTDQA